MMTTLFTIFLFLIPIYLLLKSRKKSSERLPPGSLGLPLIGQSLDFLRAMRANTAEDWLEQRIRKYGPVSKLSLFGKPTVFIHGQAANKFIFTSDGSTISAQQTESIRRILGERSISELTAEDHKRVRSALMLFMKPESLTMPKMSSDDRGDLSSDQKKFCCLVRCRLLGVSDDKFPLSSEKSDDRKFLGLLLFDGEFRRQINVM